LIATGTTSFADTPKPPPGGGEPSQSTTALAPTTQTTSQIPPGQSTPTATDAQAQPAQQPDPNERICKKDATTGTRIPMCKTRKEWEEFAKDNPGF